MSTSSTGIQMPKKISIELIRTDGGCQPRAAIDIDVVGDYAAAMADGSEFPPVVVFYDGADYWLADGYHRLAAAAQLGLDGVASDVRQGARRDAVLFSVGTNAAHGLQRTNEDKRRAVMTLLGDPEWAAWSDREIARRCAVSNDFVSRLRQKLPVIEGQMDESRLVTRNGVTYAMNITAIGGSGGSGSETASNFCEVRSASGENEWYTPKLYIEMARDVLGDIDLDPASSDHAQKTVKAGRFFSKDDSGLDKKWVGRVWLNPPYERNLMAQFVEKLVEEVRDNNVKSAIMLTHNYTDTAWFHTAAEAASAICFTRGRIKFEDTSGARAAPVQGQVFFYFGRDVEMFTMAFSEIGLVMGKLNG
jgi:phage N-6-adenine-methyltransferase